MPASGLEQVKVKDKVVVRDLKMGRADPLTCNHEPEVVGGGWCFRCGCRIRPVYQLVLYAED